MSEFKITGSLSGFNDIEKGFDDLNDSVDTSNKGFSKLSKIGLAAAAAGVAAVAASLVVGAKNLLVFGDEVQKLSINIGVGAERLSGYKLVADLTGTSFNTLTTAFAKQAKGVSEAAKGTGLAKNAINDLNINVQDLINLDPEQQFLVFADAVSGLANESDKTRIAMELWGRSGVELIATIDGGSASIEEMLGWSEKLGLSLKQSEVDGIAKFNDSIALMQGAFSGLIQQSLVALLPIVEDIGDLFFDAAIEGDGFSKSADLLTNVLKGTIVIAVGLKNIFDAVADTISATAKAAMLAAEGDFSGAWDAIKQGSRDVKSQFDDVAVVVEKLFNDSEKAVRESSFQMVLASKDAAKKRAKAHEETQKEINIGEQLFAKNMAINDQAILDNKKASLKKVAEAVAANEQAILDEYNNGMKIFAENQAINNNVIIEQNKNVSTVSQNQFTAMFDAFNDGAKSSIGSTEGWAREYNKNLTNMKNFSANTFGTITKDFGDNIGAMIVTGEGFSMKDTFQGIAIQFISMITTMLLQWAIMTLAMKTGAISMVAGGTAVNIAWAPMLLTVLAIAAAVTALIIVYKRYGIAGVAVGIAISLAFAPVSATVLAIAAAVAVAILIFKNWEEVGGAVGAALIIAFAPIALSLLAIKLTVEFIVGLFQDLGSVGGAVGAALALAFAPISLTFVAIKIVVEAIIRLFRILGNVGAIIGNGIKIALAPILATLNAIKSVSRAVSSTVSGVTGIFSGPSGDPIGLTGVSAIRSLRNSGIEVNETPNLTDENRRNIESRRESREEQQRSVAERNAANEIRWREERRQKAITEGPMKEEVRRRVTANGGWNLNNSFFKFGINMKSLTEQLQWLDVTGYATGGSFLTQGPQFFMAGERGQERVTVSPAGTSASKGGGQGANYIFNGPVILDDITAMKFSRGQIRGLSKEASRLA